MRFVLTALLWLAGGTISAQQYDYEFYGPKQGLSHQEANCMFFDDRGFVWIGTGFGLNFFDGTRFTVYYNIPGDTNSLSHNSILNIIEDKQHRLWLGTQKGVSCFDMITRQFLNYSPENSGSRKLDIENCHVFIAKDERVWIGHDKGIISLDPVTGKITSYPLQLTPAGKFRNRFVNSFAEDKEGTLWAATSYGVYAKKKNSNTFVSFRFPDDYPGEEAYNACTCILVNKEGTIICGTWNGGIIYKTSNSAVFQPAHQENETGGHITIYNILPLTDSTILMGTPNGILETSTGFLTGKKNYTITPFPAGGIDSLIFKKAIGVSKDTRNRLWLITEHGFCKMTPRNDFIRHHLYTAINNWSPQGMIESNDHRKIWVLTGKALIQYDASRQTFRALPFVPNHPREMAKSKNGYWISARPGLYHFDNNFRQLELLTHTTADGPEYFSSVLEDHEGVLWLGTGRRKGIRVYEPQSRLWRELLDNDSLGINLSGHEIGQIAEDHQENIWIASQPLVRYNRSLKKFEAFPVTASTYNKDEANTIRSLCVDKDGRLWAGTLAGLFYFDTTAHLLRQVNIPAAISPEINGITTDKNNNLWLSSKSGLVYYDRHSGKFNLFNEQNGLLNNDISSLAITPGNGNIMIGYDGGISLIDPARIKTTDTLPAPQWTSIVIDNSPISSRWNGKTPVLKYNQSIAFSFISPSYESPEKNQYAYFLSGIDKEWNYTGSNTSQRFANLPAGKYVLQIKAANPNGEWNETPVSFAFIVKPPFWKTWWFISLSIAIIVAGIYAFYRYRFNAALKMERMRTRIATDLHDDIGATLSSISMYSEAVKSEVKEQLPHLEPVLNKIGENSRSMVSSMSDIVWAINPDNDDGEKLVQRMESYARDICAIKDVHLHFSGDEKLNEIKLPLEHRKNIYLVFKEALNNALKYSNATDIAISISRNNHTLQLIVKDNGKGFNAAATAKGNGLKNMRLRAKEINSELKIASVQNEGTLIELTCHA